jgi:Ca2+-binding RTX toxin-like protein
LAASDTLNGGVGTDTLVSTIAMVDTTATATAFTNISNFETLEISNAFTGTLTTAGVQAGLETVTLAIAGAGTVNFEAGARTLNLKDATAGTLVLNDTGIATTDSLTIANTGTSTDAGANGRALTIGGFETVTINSTAAGVATPQIYGAIGITPDTGGSVTLNVSGGNSVTMADVTATSASTLTINASGLTGTAALTQNAIPVRATITTGATNIIGSANADTLFAATTGTTVDGGAGNDNIVGGTLADNLSGGLGDDTFTMASVLTSADTISGGAGVDVITALTPATVADADFTNVTSVETVAIGRAGASTTALTLGSAAAAAGINKVTLGLVGSVETVNVLAGFTNDLEVVTAVTGTNDAEVISAAAFTKNLTITATQALVTGGTLTGGTGTADKIVYKFAAANITHPSTAAMTGIETITTSGTTANNLSVTLHDANIALTKSMTIDGSNLTGGGALTVVGTAELDGSLIVIGSSSADAITGTASAVGDNLSGGAGNDTFTMGAVLTVLDTIAGGEGTDTITISGATLDAAFTKVTSVETLTATGNVTLGALAQAAGITSVTESATLTVGSGFTNALTVNLAAAGTSSVTATAYTGALTVNAVAGDATPITATNVLVGGTGTTDRLVFDLATAPTASAANLAGVTAFEIFSFKGSTVNNVSLTLDTLNAASAKTLTIDGSSLTTGVLTLDATAETNGSIVVVGGGAADLITGSASTLGDNMSGGAGDDVFTYATANLSLLDTIAGGLGADTLTISNTSTRVDADFTNITSVETLTVGTGLSQTITLGALANASGLTTITGSTTGVDTITVGAGFTNALRINLGVGTANDNIDGSASAAAINFRSEVEDIAATDVLKGGTSTGDVLTLTIDVDAQTATTTLMTGVETINVVQSATVTRDLTITMGANDTQIAAGKTLTVNATALTDAGATLTFNGTASELDGSLSVTGGNGNDTIIGGSFTDTLVGGIGVDVITGGLGADNLTGGTLADTFVFTAVAESNGTNTDSITDFVSATDKIRVTLDYTGQTANLDISAKILTAKAGTTLIQDTLSAQRGQYAYDTTGSALYVNFNADNLLTSLDYKINVNAASTATATIADGDVNFVITGGTGADTITAGNGADTISGGDGADVLQYNTGNAPAGESITGGAGTDILQVITSTTFVNAAFGTGTVLTNAAVEDIVITTGQTATFTAAQLTGQAISFNASAAGAANLVITGSDATADFTTLAFIARSGNAFDTGVDTVTINIAATTAASTTGTTLADTINGTALAETIIGGTGADSINAGAGADTITGGAGVDIIQVGALDAAIDRVVMAAVADSGTFALNAGAVNSIDATGFDVISGFVAGDVLALAAYTGIAAAGAATDLILRSGVVTQVVTVVNGTAVVGANQVGTIRGTFSAGTFAGDAAGLDLLVTYDGNAAAATTALEGVILVGAGALALTVTAGAGGLLGFA